MSSSKRIIFCLYYQDNHFYLSRNFKLQKVGDLEWLIKNFGFGQTANYIDELVVLLVKKNPCKEDFNNFLTIYQCFESADYFDNGNTVSPDEICKIE